MGTIINSRLWVVLKTIIKYESIAFSNGVVIERNTLELVSKVKEEANRNGIAINELQ